MVYLRRVFKSCPFYLRRLIERLFILTAANYYRLTASNYSLRSLILSIKHLMCLYATIIFK